MSVCLSLRTTDRFRSVLLVRILVQLHVLLSHTISRVETLTWFLRCSLVEQNRPQRQKNLQVVCIWALIPACCSKYSLLRGRLDRTLQSSAESVLWCQWMVLRSLLEIQQAQRRSTARRCVTIRCHTSPACSVRQFVLENRDVIEDQETARWLPRNEPKSSTGSSSTHLLVVPANLKCLD